MKIYESKSKFYAERGGATSGETDFGVLHVDDIGIEGKGRKPVEPVDTNIGGQPVSIFSASGSGRYTVSLVETTGDVYAWRTDEGPLGLIANIGGVDGSYKLAEQLLQGWPGPKDGPFGWPLSWFVGRLADYLVEPEEVR